MTKLLLVFISISGINAWGANTLCDNKVEDVIESYEKNNKTIESFEIKDCSSLTDGMGPIMGANRNTNAPKITESGACAIILNVGKHGLQELVVIDKMNDFSLGREFNRSDDDNFSVSRFGNAEEGTILNIQSEDGIFFKQKYITRVNYNLSSNTMQILKWKVGWITHKYSHDYTVKCM